MEVNVIHDEVDDGGAGVEKSVHFKAGDLDSVADEAGYVFSSNPPDAGKEGPVLGVVKVL
jgi:hypothetical protein